MIEVEIGEPSPRIAARSLAGWGSVANFKYRRFCELFDGMPRELRC